MCGINSTGMPHTLYFQCRKKRYYMEIKEFAIKIRKAMIEVLGEEYEVKLQEVQKNNGVLLHGLIIMKKEQNVSPTIYLKPFWEAYEGGVTLAEVVRRMIQIYREDTPKENIDMSFFKEFDKVKDKICYRLINGGQNRSLLEKIPHIPFLDLAICFFYSYESEELGNGTILIYNSHVEMWETTVTELMRLAQSNTPRLFPWECKSMEAAIRELMGSRGYEDMILGEEERKFFKEVPMYIVSNRQKNQGAVCILYPDLLAVIADSKGTNFYILPSSVHEVILLTDNGNENPQQLRSMIAEVNRSQVEPEEVLSDSLYYYNRQENRIKVI